MILETIIFPFDLEELPPYCMSYCPNLKKVILNKGLIHCKLGVWYSCQNLQKVKFEALTHLGEKSLQHCLSPQNQFLPGTLPRFKFKHLKYLE
jgi:hypothetical protein